MPPYKTNETKRTNHTNTHTNPNTHKKIAKINSSRCCKVKRNKIKTKQSKKWFVWLCVFASVVVCMWTKRRAMKTGVTSNERVNRKESGRVYDNGNANWVKLRHMNVYRERERERNKGEEKKNNRTTVKRNNTVQNIIEATAASAATSNQMKWKKRMCAWVWMKWKNEKRSHLRPCSFLLFHSLPNEMRNIHAYSKKSRKVPGRLRPRIANWAQ